MPVQACEKSGWSSPEGQIEVYRQPGEDGFAEHNVHLSGHVTSSALSAFTMDGTPCLRSKLHAPLVADGVSRALITTASLEDGAVTSAKLDPSIGVWTRSGDDVFRLGGKVCIGTSSSRSNRLQVAGMVGATAFNTTSDRAAKQDFTAVDAQAFHAAAHYARIDPELGGRFYDEIERLIRDIRSHPCRFRVFDLPVRRLLYTVFPYAVLYLDQPDRVWIVAVMHVSRRPGYWRGRLS